MLCITLTLSMRRYKRAVGRASMAQPLHNGLVFTAGLSSPTATAARSQQQTAALLYEKLQAAQQKNTLAEQRAEDATKMARVECAKVSAEQQRVQAELNQVKSRLRDVNDELERTKEPPKSVMDRVHALHAKAHIHKQRLAGMVPGTKEHEICAEV